MAIVVILIAICILNIIDCAQTVYAIQLFGLSIEANPIARWMFENDCAIALKLTIIPIILVIIGIVVYLDDRFRWVVYGMFIYYVCLLLNNAFVLVQMGAI